MRRRPRARVGPVRRKRWEAARALGDLARKGACSTPSGGQPARRAPRSAARDVASGPVRAAPLPARTCGPAHVPRGRRIRGACLTSPCDCPPLLLRAAPTATDCAAPHRAMRSDAPREGRGDPRERGTAVKRRSDRAVAARHGRPAPVEGRSRASDTAELRRHPGSAGEALPGAAPVGRPDEGAARARGGRRRDRRNAPPHGDHGRRGGGRPAAPEGLHAVATGTADRRRRLLSSHGRVPGPSQPDGDAHVPVYREGRGP